MDVVSMSREKSGVRCYWRSEQRPESLWVMVKCLEFILRTGKLLVVFGRGMTDLIYMFEKTYKCPSGYSIEE